MIKRLRGYSLLEIILVTTFIIIFLVVINPGTYIDRFSKILLKMNVLNESSLMVNKLNSFSYTPCASFLVQTATWEFINDQTSLSVRFDYDTLKIKHLSNSIDAVLYKFVDPNKSKSFFYYDSYFSPTIIPANAKFIDVIFYSSLMDHKVIGSAFCSNQSIILGEFQ